MPVGMMSSASLEGFSSSAVITPGFRRERVQGHPENTGTLLPDNVDVHGIPVTMFDSYEHAVRCVRDRINAGRKTFCVAINPEKIFGAHRKPVLRDILLKANMHICDGVGAAIAARLLHGERLPRITGVGLFTELMKAAPRERWCIYLLGASPEANEGARRRLEQDHPGIRIVGARDGFFESNEEVVRDINDSGAHMLFVAMGSPKQEQWIIDNYERLDTTFMMGVGGTYDVVSGRVNRAPAFFRKTGTEWLYRLLSQPSRWRRQTVLPRFALLTLKAKLSFK
ncbi:MAG: N-acetylglucosaminyldiphosphoundecaprenol N-acetyl-beta-D-mannosaminyltransferase [Candidatus Sumerlaeota bacterium]|nr:N-acetylglucosaminyldiphosphoundecaprenol N-acetyl-beta-D-mannosaminyltransferase [Candidatus Sumerlaeota bacterium]